MIIGEDYRSATNLEVPLHDSRNDRAVMRCKIKPLVGVKIRASPKPSEAKLFSIDNGLGSYPRKAQKNLHNELNCFVLAIKWAKDEQVHLGGTWMH